ncbi:putative UvsX [Pseudomonas phage OBP]|uniref:putative UvsX n=1 Tax=Pseudomonas phage OBP TaxID=1124849 RepID=UPI000240D5F3|nr:putative UvsX [Pseudomonas phage OBP]AEV89703.1 putative UvsX [Pseudomonas phage OBP]
MLTALNFLKDYGAESNLQIGLNVSPIFDMLTTSMIKGKDGVWYQNGGLMPINGLAGGNNTQKTGKTVKDVAALLFRFKSSVILYGDTESTLDISRLAEEVDRLFGEEGYFAENIEDIRFHYMPNSAGIDGTELHNKVIEIYKTIHALSESKDKAEQEAYKQLFLDTPFWSAKANKHVQVMQPILFICDSISEVLFDNLMFKQFDDGDMDEGGKKRTRDMEIGNLRRILMTDTCILGPRVGLRSYWIAQSADVINMDGRPKEKDSTFLRHNKKLAAPKAMLKLPHIGIEIIKGTVLKQTDHSVTYPRGKDSLTSTNAKSNPELVQYFTTVFRNKSGSSGGDIAFVASQAEGILVNLSMYDSLKENKYFGLDGSAVRHSCALLPDVSITRPTVRDMIEGPDANPKLQRAIEICWQLWYEQTFWDNFPEEWKITPAQLYEKGKERGLDWDDVLENTIYFWHDNHEVIKKHTLTIYELMEIVVGGKKPYWIKDKK